ncbi:flavodoxin domain-containing protein [Petroclostridium xylanilyticum]|uniref:flavodoxin domain-containing protein n=1 Tax=Petroclostridium xylanilyticum TaxID=1792311 RepID=UPI000B983201|nr:flavodoxin domain-containing protein [Petroclostridium xylanilyticum]
MSDNINKVVVIYKSKYGSAQRYAQWIADEVKADLFERSKITLNDILKYDTIVYGGSLYAAGILGISLIKKNFDRMKDKKVIVFSVGASPAHPEAINDIINNNFTEEMKEKVHFFHLRGGFNYKKLNPIDRVLMYFLKKKIEHKKPDELTDDEKGMLACYKHPADWTNKKSINPIIESIKSRSPGLRRES